MSIKDLFNKNQVNKVVSSKSLEKLGVDAESANNIVVERKKANEFIPSINFFSASNFAVYGSAAKYYDDAIKRIYNEFPYDGSEAEINEFALSSSYLDRHIFDNGYPRTTGYIILSADGWGTGGSQVGGYGTPTSAEYISLQGGPHTDRPLRDSFASAFTGSHNTNNIYDPANGRGSNLALNPTSGSMVEFWMRKTEFLKSLTNQEVIFDLWNNEAAGSTSYGRLRIEMTQATPPFRVTYRSGSAGFTNQTLGSMAPTTVADSAWHHYAFSFSSSSNGLMAQLYVDGELDATETTAAYVKEIDGSLEATIGALITATGPAGAAELGYGKMSGSLDEFRYWKIARTGEEIGRNWWTQVRGGSNTDKANTDLGVYYKFNEGITTTSSIDSVVLDYSGRITNGTWTGYDSSARNTGSAIVSASAAPAEFEDPIIRIENSLITDYQAAMALSGAVHDESNTSSIYATIPEWITDNDPTGDLSNLTQIVASYFDKLHSQIKEVPKLKDVQYLSASAKQYPFSSHLVDSAGLLATDIFVDADILETVMSRDEDRNYDLDLDEIKNRIYQNIYNNLVYIYKSKGTEKAFRNLIHCYGVGDELIRLNTYGNNITYNLKDNFRASTLARNIVDFGHSDRFNATVYQYTASSNVNSVSFISGTADDPSDPTLADFIPITLESEAIFPPVLNLCCGVTGSFRPEFTTSSVFGMHSAKDTLPYDTTWPTNDYADLRVVAIKDTNNVVDAKFKLTSSIAGIPELTSSYFKDVYDNTKWNIAIRVVNEKYPIGNFVTGAALSGAGEAATPYRVEFYGVNSDLDIIRNDFYLTGTLSNTTALNLLRSPKRVFGGAHRTNFTGSEIQQSSDVKLSSVRYWTNYIPNATIQAHARDSEVYGAPSASLNSFVTQNSLTGTYIPQADTLALNWSFYDVTGSNASGQFTVADFSSGSAELQTRYGWLGKIVQAQHTGRGDYFPANSNKSVDKTYIPIAKQSLPEIVQSSEMVRILDGDDENFTRDQRPVDYFFSIEKSMNQVISDEIINMFGTIKEFNRLIGDPINRYRQEYKLMKKARNLFFEGVENTPDLDKFVSFYKWIDSSLNTFLMQLVPASANASDTVRTIVESHVLERNKYWTKFPTLEGMRIAPSGATPTVTLGVEDTFPTAGPCVRAYSNIEGVVFSNASHLNRPGFTLPLSGDGLDPADTGAFTISTWLTASTTQTGEKTIFSFGSSGAAHHNIALLNSANSHKLQLNANFTTTDATWTTDSAVLTTADQDTSYHIVVAFDDSGDEPLVYVNGTEADGAFSSSPAGDFTAIGSISTIGSLRINSSGFNTNGKTFRGCFGDMTLWNKKLSAAEILELRQTVGSDMGEAFANAGPIDYATHSAYSNLISWWKFGEGSGDSVTTSGDKIFDQKGDNDATIQEGVTHAAVKAFGDTVLEAQGGGTYTGRCTTGTDLGDQRVHQAYWQQSRPRDKAPLATGDATLDEQREELRQAYYPASTRTQYVQMSAKDPGQRSSPRRIIHGGINYPRGKERSLVYNATEPFGPTTTVGTPLNVMMIDATNVDPLQNITSSAPIEMRKKFYDYKVSIRREDETGTKGLNNDTLTSVMKGVIGSPFSLVSSSVTTGYNHAVVNRFRTGSEIVNLHSDTTSPTNHIPMQGPFTQQHVGGRLDRHLDINRYDSSLSTPGSIDDYTSRPEGWQILMGPEHAAVAGTSIMGIVGPDYPASSESTYPSNVRRIAVKFRNSRAKRPVNIRNIQHTTASVNLGNYSKVYEIVQTAGRTTNNKFFVSASAPLPSLYINSLKTTTNPNSLVGIGASIRGNYFGTNVGNLGDYFESTTNYSLERTSSKSQIQSVFVNRFAAPGSPEVSSLGYLDIVAKEKSVYNALPFRNLSLVSSGSGEASTIRIDDQLSKRRGLRTLLALHAGQFGSDGTFGTVTAAEYVTKPSYQQNNRNTRKRIEFSGIEGFDKYGATITGSVYDNANVTHPIPRSDIQYSWISSSYSLQRIYGHAWNDSYVSMSSGVYQAIDFVSASDISFSGSIKIDFAGLNTLVVDPVDTSNNILSSSTNTYTNGDFNFSLSASQVLNGLLLHRNGPYGVCSWRQTRAGSTPVARALRKKNLISYVQKNNYNYPANVVSGVISPMYDLFQQFTESPVVSKFSPLVQSLVVNNLNSDDAITQSPLRIGSTYANNLTAFSHTTLNNRYNISEKSPQNYDRIKDLYLRNQTENPDSPVNAFDYLLYRETIYPALINAYSSSVRVRKNYVNTFWRDTRVDRARPDVPSFAPGHNILTQSMWSLDGDIDILTRVVTTRVSKEFSDTDDGGAGILQNMYSQISTRSTTPRGGNVNLPVSPLYARRHTETRNIRSVVGPEGIPIPETGSGGASSYTTRNMSVRFQPDTQAFGGQAVWDARGQSGRTPWYNSYDDFVSQMRLKGKDYSVVPEFRISEHLSTYVNANSGDFLADNRSMFEVSGGTESINDSSEANFYKTYSNSDFLRFFELVKDEHAEIADPTSIGLRCKGLLKFLPYNGFYPSERMIQLANQFSSSYGDFVQYSISSSAGVNSIPTTTASFAAMAAFVQPVYHPGLMFNTIKSGIAVDYPIITASLAIYGGPHFALGGGQELLGALGCGSLSGSGASLYGANKGSGRFDLRLPFETLLEPENYISDIDICNNETHASSAQNCTASWGGDGDSLYKLMAGNFYGEVPDFFLPEGQFTSLVSAPESRWEAVENGKTYAARVKIRKSYNRGTTRTGSLGYRNPLTPIVEWFRPGDLNENFTMYSRPSAFGPDVGSAGNFYGSTTGFNPCFTPPYYYGEAWADVFFTAPASGSFTIDQLLSPDNLAVSYLRIGDGWIIDKATQQNTILHKDDIEYNSMQLDASFNLFGSAQIKRVTYDPDSGTPVSVQDDASDNVWVMQTKFETPMLDFSNVEVTDMTYGSGSVARGMWHQYGVVPNTPQKGIFFSVGDIPAAYISGALGGDPSVTGSLVEIVGLATEEKRLGETASTKVIKEAIVAVPYTEDGSQRSFFSIPRAEIVSALSGNLEPTNSIQQMVDAMTQYVMPPRMDFVKNPDRVDPFAMYIFEFEHTLDRDDLTDIWQGLLPKIGYAFDDESNAFKEGNGAPTNQVVKEVSISHPLLAQELLSASALNSNVRWMVFKVKRQANKNYFNKVIKDQINANDNFDKGRAAQIGREDSTRVSEPKYSYNWPYDFFSLVELIKIDAEVEISNHSSDE